MFTVCISFSTLTKKSIRYVLRGIKPRLDRTPGSKIPGSATGSRATERRCSFSVVVLHVYPCGRSA